MAEQQFVAFMGLYDTAAQDGYLGAVLVTTTEGIPIEFRCTNPVKPTSIQKPLYGEALKPHIGVKLCGVPLLQSLQHKPNVIVVQEEYLLAIRPSSAFPVVLVRRAGQAVEMSSDGQGQPRRERLESSEGSFSPIVFSAHSEFEEDAKAGKLLLEKTGSNMDPLEPFQRMGKAIEVLAKQDVKFQ